MTTTDPVTGLSATPPEAPGTSETAWTQWLRTAGPWPPLRMAVQRLVVLAAHPDDDVLGAGGIMSAAAAAGVDVVSVCLSDGAGSHPGSPTLSPHQLADRRHRELDCAAGILGLDTPRWCGLPDGSLAAHPGAIAGIVDDVLAEAPATPTALLSVWSHDGHPDHEAVGRSAVNAAARHSIDVWMYPVWMWHWAMPGCTSIPWNRLRAHRLDTDGLITKIAAVDAFVTQIAPLSSAPADRTVLEPHVLARLLRPTEFVFS